MLNDRGEVAFAGAWQSGVNRRSGVFVARPAGPRLELRPLTDGTLELRFPTVAGATYHRQWRAWLAAGVWEDLGLPVTGDGGTSSTGVPVDTGSSGACFRVVATY